jgi:hypothetical protein
MPMFSAWAGEENNRNKASKEKKRKEVGSKNLWPIFQERERERKIKQVMLLIFIWKNEELGFHPPTNAIAILLSIIYVISSHDGF